MDATVMGENRLKFILKGGVAEVYFNSEHVASVEASVELRNGVGPMAPPVPVPKVGVQVLLYSIDVERQD